MGDQDFLHTTLGKLGRSAYRLGLSASYRPGAPTVHRALEAGVNLFFCYGFDGQMTGVLRGLSSSQRQQLVYVTGAYHLFGWHPHLRRSLEKRLRQLGTDYLDCFLFLGVMRKQEFLEGVLEELRRFREEGKVLAMGVSIHDRKLAGALAARGAVDVLMMRYNAAHRGAETETFPFLADLPLAARPGLVTYTATRWGQLLKQKHMPPGEAAPPAADCYRFALTHPAVDVCMTGPKNQAQMREALRALDLGPMEAAELARLRRVGDYLRG